MNRTVTLGAVAAAFLAFAATAGAHPAQNGFDASPVFTNDYGDHYVHMHDSPRFNFDAGNAPRGIANDNGNADPDDNAAVSPHGSGILINPRG